LIRSAAGLTAFAPVDSVNCQYDPPPKMSGKEDELFREK
jgi:hypothetical protein